MSKKLRTISIKDRQIFETIKNRSEEKEIFTNTGKHFLTLIFTRDLSEQERNKYDLHYGYIITKRNVPLAVDRNHLKRRIRDIIRNYLEVPFNKRPLYTVLIARKSAATASFEDLQKEIEKAFNKYVNR